MIIRFPCDRDRNSPGNSWFVRNQLSGWLSITSTMTRRNTTGDKIMANTTTLEIHPAIGIARLGTSQEFFIGPEPGAPIPTDRRDTTPDKLLKRQAARFRVYSCVRDPQGNLVSFHELSTAEATISLPHSPQNLSPGWLETPHAGHKTTSGAPQPEQNLRPSRLSLPHFEQHMNCPFDYERACTRTGTHKLLTPSKSSSLALSGFAHKGRFARSHEGPARF